MSTTSALIALVALAAVLLAGVVATVVIVVPRLIEQVAGSLAGAQTSSAAAIASAVEQAVKSIIDTPPPVQVDESKLLPGRAMPAYVSDDTELPEHWDATDVVMPDPAWMRPEAVMMGDVGGQFGIGEGI